MIKLSDLIGKPYKDGGRGPDYYDCWGLCMEVARRAGIELPEFNVAIDNELRGRLINEQKKAGFHRLNKPVSWSLVLFRIWDDHNNTLWHVGIVLENCRQFIHITGNSFVCITDLKRGFWDIHLEGFYKYAAD